MASTYSNLKIELIGTGDQSGTWGVTTNTNLGTAIEEAITGSADVAFSSADVTLTLTNTNGAQTARNLRLNLVGSVSTTQNLIVPAIEKQYIINNTLGSAITVKNTTGTGIAVPAGKTMFVFNNGTNVVDAVTHATSLTLGAALPVASGGTGSTSTTFVNAATNVTGTLPIANGGTGTTSTTFTNLTTNVTGTLPVANGGTGATTLTGLVLGNATSAFTTVTAPSGTVVGTTDTQTLTNKRITSRSLAAASTSGTVTPASDTYDQVNYLLTGTAAFAVPSGTPTNGQKLNIRLYAASTQTVSWTTTSTGYRIIGTVLPTSVASGKTVYVGCVWNSTDSFWDVVAVATQV